MPKATSRPCFPTSLSDFALPTSTSPGASTSALSLDDPGFILHRLRRPNLLAARHHSPLASSFTFHTRRRSHSSTRTVADDLESDRERMSTDSPTSSSGNPTPPLKTSEATDDTENNIKTAISKLPSTPPRRRSSSSIDAADPYLPMSCRRLAFPVRIITVISLLYSFHVQLRQPRISTLLAESHPEEIEVKSEAAFQRLISSFSELPTQPRTPRSTADRGRYPEEAGHDESQREETPSDDDGPPEDTLLFSTPGSSEPINIIKTRKPNGSVNGDEFGTSLSECSSYGNGLMDIDLVCSSPVHLKAILIATSRRGPRHPYLRHQHLYHTGGVRHHPSPVLCGRTSENVSVPVNILLIHLSDFKTVDERFDPYPSASKRRAVSPSVSHLRETHGSLGSPISRNSNSRLPIAIPITIPGSTASSATSSPTIGGSFASSYPRTMSSTSSPTLRASTMGLASPILRPVARGSVSVRRGDEEREVEGAGEAVGGMTLS